MTAALHFLRHTRLFSAFCRRRTAAARHRAVRFRPAFDAVEHRTLLSSFISAVSKPGPVYIGDFDGRTDQVTVNPGSNDITLISGYGGSNPVTSTISSGGVSPSVAFAVDTPSGYEDLVVGNTGNGVLALFAGSSTGLTLESSMKVPDLKNAVALVISRVSSHEVRFFLLLQSPLPGVPETQGPFFLVLANPLSSAPHLVAGSGFDITVGQPTTFPQGSSGVAQLVPLQETSLALIGTLLPISTEAPAAALRARPRPRRLARWPRRPPLRRRWGSRCWAAEICWRRLPRGATAAAYTEREGLGGREMPARAAWQRYTLGTGDAIERFDRENPDLFGTASERDRIQSGASRTTARKPRLRPSF